MIMDEINIFSYYDYHKYLQDYYEKRKAIDSYFSYRYISNKVNLDHGLIIKIFQGKRHLSRRSIINFVKILNLTKNKAEYFELLVLFGRAKSEQEIKHYFEKILTYSDLGERTIDADSYEFYQKWYYTAVREVLHMYKFTGDYENLASLLEPSISISEAKQAVKLLLRLNFIYKNSSTGFYELTDKFITTGKVWKSFAIRQFQSETMSLAQRAIEKIPIQERNISTITFTLDRFGLDQVNEKINQFQKDLLKIASSCNNVNRVYQVNLQVFPLSKEITSGEEK